MVRRGIFGPRRGSGRWPRLAVLLGPFGTNMQVMLTREAMSRLGAGIGCLMVAWGSGRGALVPTVPGRTQLVSPPAFRGSRALGAGLGEVRPCWRDPGVQRKSGAQVATRVGGAT